MEVELLKVASAKLKVNVHQLEILHGRYIFTARKAKCAACVIEGFRDFKGKSNTLAALSLF